MSESAVAFFGLVDLASQRLGSRVIETNDDFFAEKENLINPKPSIFIPDKYTDRGKWMDGWESKRKRGKKDWDHCIVELAIPGRIKIFDIDTAHFLGNHPPYASIEVRNNSTHKTWTKIVQSSGLKPGSHNYFVPEITVDSVTHIKLNIFPDGGVARLRAFGNAQGLPTQADQIIDLAALSHGGNVLAASDSFFSPMHNLIQPGISENMGDGWETRRRRDTLFDWVIVKLAKPAVLQSVLIQTTHYKGNYPEAACLEGCLFNSDDVVELQILDSWMELIPRSKLSADSDHKFSIQNSQIISHIRLKIFPDGGIARLRVFGKT